MKANLQDNTLIKRRYMSWTKIEQFNIIARGV